MVDQTINSQQKDPKGCTLSPQLVFKVAYELERKTKLLEGPGNLFIYIYIYILHSTVYIYIYIVNGC